MIGFRKRIIISDFVILLVFSAFFFPFIGKTVDDIARVSLEKTVEKTTAELVRAKDETDLISLLKGKERYIFYRLALLDKEGSVIYDSHPKVKEGRREKEELKRILLDKKSYSERYSDIFGQHFAFVSKSFDFQGNQYVLRAAFPLKEMGKLKDQLEIAFFIFLGGILILYSILTWLVIYQQSKPIEHIIRAISPYQGGKEENLPNIEIDKSLRRREDFKRLALTLNSLSEKIRGQIDNLTFQRNENETILNSLMEGVLALDGEGRLTYLNEVAANMLGIKELKSGSPLNEVKSQEMIFAKCAFLLEKCQIEKRVLKEKFLSFGNIYLDIIAVPKKESGAVLILQDRTSDYMVLEMGRAFVANASHELKTPITVIQGYAETLLDMPAVDEKTLKNVAEKILKTTKRLHSLVESLLILSEAENLTYSHFKDCDIKIILDVCRKNILSFNKDVIVDLEKTKKDVIIKGDSSLLELVFMNILENAIKYSEGKAEIIVKLWLEDKWAKISITDKGIGIPKQDLPHIFDRFYTVDKARSRKMGGAGLGLSIVKTIVEKHGGFIEAYSAETGTTFTVSLPW